ncbi:coenzyme F420-0:L-glutamate ligase [Vibrio salinus]|uniref:coenzyme F420-0:L-glutamate ligase n=1 Tax=Vibrio salinus TaxID=2899784 RepID=UPI001E3D229B|nr:coenzyme F420-0:L-glutamate ligase [Vibrio salinus]MCE0493692.1 coenzyme F420-0:L-glutamate ligase [Vibrio salinus]
MNEALNFALPKRNRTMEMISLEGLPDIVEGMDLAGEIYQVLSEQNNRLQQGDILVIAHKVVSKSEGNVFCIDDITPGKRALELAKESGKDARKIEVILGQSKRILRCHKRPGQTEGIIIAEHKLGFICANSAVDESNADSPGQLITLPENPDHSAQHICHALEHKFQCQLGVVISDTFGRPWRMGQTNVAIGVANVPAIKTMEGKPDAWGRTLKVTAPAFADELAAASGLLMDKEGKCPVMIFRGLDWTPQASNTQQLIRPKQEDLFR